MFKAIKKFLYRNKKPTHVIVEEEKSKDEIELSLWDIKEAYDLETEEVVQVVKNYKLRHVSKKE